LRASDSRNQVIYLFYSYSTLLFFILFYFYFIHQVSVKVDLGFSVVVFWDLSCFKNLSINSRNAKNNQISSDDSLIYKICLLDFQVYFFKDLFIEERMQW